MENEEVCENVGKLIRRGKFKWFSKATPFLLAVIPPNLPFIIWEYNRIYERDGLKIEGIFDSAFMTLKINYNGENVGEGIIIDRPFSSIISIKITYDDTGWIEEMGRILESEKVIENE